MPALSTSTYGPVHAVCITGLERSYPEISHNIHYSLSNFYGAWRGIDGQDATADAAAGSSSSSSRWRLEDSVAFFGVRPANDSWPTVRTDLPPLTGESIQTPCGLGRAPWFSAWAKTKTQQAMYGFSFIQMMCDLRACHQMVLAHERKVARDFATVARMRLDLAWETPLVMPPRLMPGTVYTSRMNTKTGINDKWAIGLRSAMAAYFERVRLIPMVNAMWNKSAHSVGLKASGRAEGLLNYDCGAGKVNIAFRCFPRRTVKTEWQRPDAVGLAYRSDLPVEVPSHPLQRRFAMSSEGFLMWALWRANMSIAFEPSWMFCKFGNAVNFTARVCVPRMRRRGSCMSLVCAGGTTDCLCRNQTCAGKNPAQPMWYCEAAAGKQLALDPYAEGAPGVF